MPKDKKQSLKKTVVPQSETITVDHDNSEKVEAPTVDVNETPTVDANATQAVAPPATHEDIAEEAIEEKVKLEETPSSQNEKNSKEAEAAVAEGVALEVTHSDHGKKNSEEDKEVKEVVGAEQLAAKVEVEVEVEVAASKPTFTEDMVAAALKVINDKATNIAAATKSKARGSEKTMPQNDADVRIRAKTTEANFTADFTDALNAELTSATKTDADPIDLNVALVASTISKVLTTTLNSTAQEGTKSDANFDDVEALDAAAIKNSSFGDSLKTQFCKLNDIKPAAKESTGGWFRENGSCVTCSSTMFGCGSKDESNGGTPTIKELPKAKTKEKTDATTEGNDDASTKMSNGVA